MNNVNISFCGLATAAIIFALQSACYAEITDVQVVKGKCKSSSHIAEGPIGDDLTKRQSQFLCDSAAISFFDNHSKHLMISFAESKSNHSPQFAFAGYMEDDGQIINLQHVYLQSSQPIIPSEGVCKFFFKNRHMSEILCAAKIDEGGRRTSVIISFKAAPGQ